MHSQPAQQRIIPTDAGELLSNNAKRLSVLIVDDHPVMREGLRVVIGHEEGFEVVGEAGDGREAIEAFQRCRPDVTLVDLQMPEVDGLEAIGAIRQASPDAVIIVLTTYPGDARVRRAFTLGATSYLLKTASGQEIIRAIRSALNGRHTIASTVAQQVASHTKDEALTEREIAVLCRVAEGRSNKEIADALFISEDTVKARMKTIMGKLGAEDRTHAVIIAMRRGFFDSMP